MDGDLSSLAFVLAMSVAAGGVNALAGGGTFFTFPALVSVGVPPVVASATSTAAVLPGYLAGAWASHRDADPVPGLPTGTMLAACAAGGICGASLLLVTPRAIFAHLVPWFLLLATALFALAPLITQSLRGTVSPKAAVAGVFAASAYGGYFNGGLGIVLLAALSLVGRQPLLSLNSWKARLSVVLTIISVAIYAMGDVIVWRLALPMMAGSFLGGYAGTRIFSLLPKQPLRWAIIAAGATCTVLFWRGP